MTKNITLSVPDELYTLMKEHPEISWSTIARRGMQAFAKVLAKSDESEEAISSKYGKNVASRFSMSIGENYGENKFQAEAGMLGSNFNAGINFNINVQPTKQQVHQNQTLSKKEVL